MRWSESLLSLLLVVGFVGMARAEELKQSLEKKTGLIGSLVDCAFETSPLVCASRTMGKEIDRIEMETTGRGQEPVPMSKVIEEGASLIADGIQAIFGDEDDDDVDEIDGEVEEARKKKFGKKKKKALQKLLMIGMLVKSKISLILQLVSTHLQIKFFIIAIISLFLNAARFWIDVKKSTRPQKVIYYEHAQHQHHYDHDDDHGLWGRSSVESPQDVAYNAYAPEN
ncbi:hypothetical protein QAD02_015168 [Eretmocerus hayati]|uniref:Uncharacterized protein n=1 Tax=Eretmocerus hayati TaxID=131215 RepID=A0ACC2P8Q1_9HYME|nr:hypothetical protein QAD02_015168 [Eretmocerus hayati]